MLHYGALKLPLKPMIGVIGVAPADAEGSWPTDTPWKHGGNMDCTALGCGAAVYLPVSQKGALLALGDCHAVMGDGEVGCAGGEIAATVTLKVSLIKEKTILWPLIETGSETLVIASGKTIEEAAFSGVNEAVKYIQKSLKLSFEEAYLLTGLVADVRINQLVNPMKTVRVAISQELVTTATLLNAL